MKQLDDLIILRCDGKKESKAKDILPCKWCKIVIIPAEMHSM